MMVPFSSRRTQHESKADLHSGQVVRTSAHDNMHDAQKVWWQCGRRRRLHSVATVSQHTAHQDDSASSSSAARFSAASLPAAAADVAAAAPAGEVGDAAWSARKFPTGRTAFERLCPNGGHWRKAPPNRPSMTTPRRSPDPWPDVPRARIQSSSNDLVAVRPRRRGQGHSLPTTQRTGNGILVRSGPRRGGASCAHRLAKRFPSMIF
eukprot:ctg_4722.g744